MPKLTAEQIAHWDESRQPEIIATSIIFLVLCNVSVAVRVVAQLRLSGRLFLDDYSIIFAAACSNLFSALYLVSTHNGLGLHLYRVFAEDPNPPQKLITLFRSLYINAVFTGPCFLAIKVSLLWFYKRTFLVNQRWLKIAWWINMVYVILWAIGTTLFYILQCVPPDYYWNRLYVLFDVPAPYPIHGQCDSSTADLIAIPLILSLVSDVAILLLPVVTVSRLRMRFRRKLALLCLFSLGFLACLCEAARIWLETRSSGKGDDDPTYSDVSFVIFTFATSTTAIVAACGPLIASQWKWTFQHIKSSFSSSSILSGERSTEMSKNSYLSRRHDSSRSDFQHSQVNIVEMVREPVPKLPTNEQILVTRDVDIELETGRVEHRPAM